MFSNKSVELLTSMRIDAAKYYEFLFDRFGSKKRKSRNLKKLD